MVATGDRQHYSNALLLRGDMWGEWLGMCFGDHQQQIHTHILSILAPVSKL